MHEFDLTRNGKTYHLGVTRSELDIAGDDPDAMISYMIEVEDFDGSTSWRPLRDIYPNADCNFSKSKIVAACAAIGSQTVANAADYRAYTEALAERLAKDAWGD